MKAYQYKITLKDSHPPIWRRIVIPACMSFLFQRKSFNFAINEFSDLILCQPTGCHQCPRVLKK
ncbi:MAG: hypothetical protein IKD66_13970 [Solobacterium sp.]|nr:hypothetical protein [Solobacterium sp.]